jgi:hypothetical protein
MFLYLTNGDILGIIQAYLDLTKKSFYDMGFGNWVGLNWTLRSALSKVLHL